MIGSFGRIVLFAAVFLLAIVVMFPLRLAANLAPIDLGQARITGTIWRGQIEGAEISGYPVGRISLAGRPLSLLRGRFGADIEVAGAVAAGKAAVGLSATALTFDTVDLDVSLAPLQLKDAFGAPMGGQLSVTAARLVLTPEGCEAGTVTVWTDTLQQSASLYGGEGFPLSGDGVCRDGALILPLGGEGGEGVARANIRVGLGGYQTEFFVEPTSPELADALEGFGFQPQGTGWSFIQRGEVF